MKLNNFFKIALLLVSVTINARGAEKTPSEVDHVDTMPLPVGNKDPYEEEIKEKIKKFEILTRKTTEKPEAEPKKNVRVQKKHEDTVSQRVKMFDKMSHKAEEVADQVVKRGMPKQKYSAKRDDLVERKPKELSQTQSSSEAYGLEDLQKGDGSRSESTIRFLEDPTLSRDMEEEYRLDQEYNAFIQTHYPNQMRHYRAEEFRTTVNPVRDFNLIYPDKKPNLPLAFAIGRYSLHERPLSPRPWLEKISEHNFNNVVQGWKIHVSATPKSAKKIAAMVLPLLNQVEGLKGDFVSHKIAITLPSLRTLNGMRNVQGDETQAGKFLVIYPDSHEHFVNLIRTIDGILVKAIQKNILTADDFFPIKGDTKVGYSGGVFVRYGAFAGMQVVKVSPKGKPLPPKTEQGKREGMDLTLDNRRRPWPDFMNKQGDWKKAPDQFGKLPAMWESFAHPENKVEGWKDRPESWEKKSAKK